MRIFYVKIAFLFVACLTFSHCHATSVRAQERTLYQRLGGYDALAAVTDDFLARLAADKQLARFLIGLSDDSKKKLRQHFLNFLCQATGGPCLYTGRDMLTSHKGLGITQADWDASVKDLIATFDKFKVPERERNEILTAIGSLRKDIVEK